MSIQKSRAHIAPLRCAVSSICIVELPDMQQHRPQDAWDLREIATGPHTERPAMQSALVAWWRHLSASYITGMHAKRTRFEVADERGKSRLCARSLWSGHRTWSRRGEDKGPHGPANNDVRSPLHKTRWRNAQLPANTDTRQLRSRGVITVTTRTRDPAN